MHVLTSGSVVFFSKSVHPRPKYKSNGKELYYLSHLQLSPIPGQFHCYNISLVSATSEPGAVSRETCA